MPDVDCYGCKPVVTFYIVNIFLQTVVLTEIVYIRSSGNSATSSAKVKKQLSRLCILAKNKHFL